MIRRFVALTLKQNLFSLSLSKGCFFFWQSRTAASKKKQSFDKLRIVGLVGGLFLLKPLLHDHLLQPPSQRIVHAQYILQIPINRIIPFRYRGKG